MQLRRWRIAPLLAASWRWIAAVELTLLAGLLAGALALLFFADLTDEMLERETLWLDLAVLDALRSISSPALDTAAAVVSFFGFEAILVLFAVLLARFLWHGQRMLAAQLVLVTLGVQVLNSVLKAVFERPRPEPILTGLPGQVFSFPSGHAMVAAGFYFFIVLLAWRRLRGWPRLLVSAGLLLLVGLIGLSRLYLGVHYFTDVVAGYAAGFIWADAVLLAFGLAPGRRARQRGRNVGSVTAHLLTRLRAVAAAKQERQ